MLLNTKKTADKTIYTPVQSHPMKVFLLSETTEMCNLSFDWQGITLMENVIQDVITNRAMQSLH